MILKTVTLCYILSSDIFFFAKSLQSCPTLCDPIDGSPPGSPVPGILQARTLEWVAISFSNAWQWKVKVKSLSRVRPSATTWTAAYQAPPSMGFSRQEYWSGVPLCSPVVLPFLGCQITWNHTVWRLIDWPFNLSNTYLRSIHVFAWFTVLFFSLNNSSVYRCIKLYWSIHWLKNNFLVFSL